MRPPRPASATVRLAAFASLLLFGSDSAVSQEPEAPKPGPGVDRVRFPGTGGAEIEADWHPGRKGMPAFVCAAADEAEQSAWSGFAKQRPDGFGALVLRGGLAGAQRNVAGDLRTAVDWVRSRGEVDPRRLAILGGGPGLPGVLQEVAVDDRLAGFWILGWPSRGAGAEAKPESPAVGGRPLFLACGEGDDDDAARAALVPDPCPPDVKVAFLVPLTRGEIVESCIRGRSSADTREWVIAAAGRQILDGKVDAWEAAAFAGDRGIASKPSEDKAPGEGAGARVRWDGAALSVFVRRSAAYRKEFPDRNEWFDVRIKSHSILRGGVRLIGDSRPEKGVAAIRWRMPTLSGGEEDIPVKASERMVFSDDFVVEVRIPWPEVRLSSGDSVRVVVESNLVSPLAASFKVP